MCGEMFLPSLKVSKGWFNLEEDSFEVYQGSKLKKLVELIKFAMQVCILPP